jgi:hypothetical protein
MSTRELVETTESFRRYRVRDDDGQYIGTDVETIPTPAQVNGATIRGRVAATLSANAAYLALPSPTNAQNAAQVQRLTRLTTALAKLMLEQLDTTDGT